MKNALKNLLNNTNTRYIGPDNMSAKFSFLSRELAPENREYGLYISKNLSNYTIATVNVRNTTSQTK